MRILRVVFTGGTPAPLRLFDRGRVQFGLRLCDRIRRRRHLGVFAFEPVVIRLLFIANVSQPRSWWLAFSGRNFKEYLLNFRSDFAALAVSDLDAIDGTNR